MYTATCIHCGAEIHTEHKEGTCVMCGRLFLLEWPARTILGSKTKTIIEEYEKP